MHFKTSKRFQKNDSSTFVNFFLCVYIFFRLFPAYLLTFAFAEVFISQRFSIDFGFWGAELQFSVFGFRFWLGLYIFGPLSDT